MLFWPSAGVVGSNLYSVMDRLPSPRSLVSTNPPARVPCASLLTSVATFCRLIGLPPDILATTSSAKSDTFMGADL
jgi:hypothetical protein